MRFSTAIPSRKSIMPITRRLHETRMHAFQEKPQQSTVFQLHPPCGQVTLEDVDDIYPVCSNIADEKQRYACYACHGMDMNKVEKYYPIVKQLDSQIQNMEPTSEHPLEFRFGKIRIRLDVLE